MSSQLFKRADRVGESIVRELCQILRDKVNDPRLTEVIITGIKVTDDLKEARIYFNKRFTLDDAAFGATTFSDDKAVAGRLEPARHSLERAAGFIKRELAQTLNLRFMPQLIFVPDVTFAKAQRLDHIFQIIHNVRDKDNVL